MYAGALLCQSNHEFLRIFGCRTDPKIHILGKHGSAIKDCRLAAD